MQRALKKLDTIKGAVIWWDQRCSGRRSFSPTARSSWVRAYNGRLFSLIEEEKQPVAMLWDWQVFDLDGWIIPKGTRNLEEGEEIRPLRHRHPAAGGSGQVQFRTARDASHRPCWSASTRHWVLTWKPHMPTDPNNAKTTLLYNYEFWGR